MGSIQTQANYFMDKYHSISEFSFDKSVERIKFSNCFFLKIFNANNEINRIYIIIPVEQLVSETSQPFDESLISHFQGALTNPAKNYWLGHIQVDRNNQPIDSRIYEIPVSFSF